MYNIIHNIFYIIKKNYDIIKKTPYFKTRQVLYFKIKCQISIFHSRYQFFARLFSLRWRYFTNNIRAYVNIHINCCLIRLYLSYFTRFLVITLVLLFPFFSFCTISCFLLLLPSPFFGHIPLNIFFFIF